MCDNDWCSAKGKTHAQREQGIIDTILKYGQQVLGIYDTDDPDAPPFFYTVGRSVKYQPELLITGPLPAKVAQHMLNEAARMQDEDGVPLAPGFEFPPDTLLERHPCRVVAVDPEASEMHQAINLFGDDITALQLIWPDLNGHFPDDPEYDARFVQPVHAA